MFCRFRIVTLGLSSPPESDRTTTSITWNWQDAPEVATIAGLRYNVLSDDGATMLARGLTSTTFELTGMTPNEQRGVLVVASTPEGYESTCVLDAATDQVDCPATMRRYSLVAVAGE